VSAVIAVRKKTVVKNTKRRGCIVKNAQNFRSIDLWDDSSQQRRFLLIFYEAKRATDP
jgi:hypothetical protein